MQMKPGYIAVCRLSEGKRPGGGSKMQKLLLCVQYIIEKEEEARSVLVWVYGEGATVAYKRASPHLGGITWAVKAIESTGQPQHLNRQSHFQSKRLQGQAFSVGQQVREEGCWHT